MTPLVTKAVKFSTDPESFMWFDVGSMTNTPQKRIAVDFLLHLPFSRTAVTGIDSNNAQFLLWLSQYNDSVTVGGGDITNSRFFEPFVYFVVNNELKFYRASQEVNNVDVKSVMVMIACILDKLNVSTTAFKAEATKSFINHTRRAKGKPPALFSWSTVTVNRPHSIIGCSTGTHASPRLHDRRGHWRTYPSGKKGWVKACKVGDASKGVVFKDYKLQSVTDVTNPEAA